VTDGRSMRERERDQLVSVDCLWWQDGGHCQELRVDTENVDRTMKGRDTRRNYGNRHTCRQCSMSPLVCEDAGQRERSI
jgi:hypothetical protein